MSSKRISGHLCCVEGCRSKTGKKEPGVHLYRFPGKPHELELKKRWIKAVNRKNDDGSEWQPKNWSRVCSKHFILGKKSNIHDHPSSVPSIFPWTTRISTAEVKAQLEKVKLVLETSRRINDEEDAWDRRRNEAFPEKSTRDVKTQVMMVLDPDDSLELTFFFSRDDKNNAGVQCKIPYHTSLVKKEMVDAGCNPINPRFLCGGFQGFSSIANESQLLATTGLTFEGFGKLTDLFQENLSKTIQNETVVLMFLMKLRLDLSYTVLSVIFRITHITAKVLIVKTMNLLYIKTKDSLSWPGEFTKRLKWNMNEEIPFEQQFYVGHRIIRFTHCKRKSTTKFLIGVSQNGQIMFKSRGYDETASSEFMTTDCGFLEMLEPQDTVIASAPLELPGNEGGQGFPEILPLLLFFFPYE
uniref:THAP domain-containing protein 11 n=1 Tax=Lygus hesperus TaxID=30085 RepID=A0A146LLD0_LYGHE